MSYQDGVTLTATLAGKNFSIALGSLDGNIVLDCGTAEALVVRLDAAFCGRRAWFDRGGVATFQGQRYTVRPT